MIFRPRSFGAKLLWLFVLVVAVAQFATWLIVSTAHRRQAQALIDAELQRAAATFSRVVAERNDVLTAAAGVAARDYAFKQLFAEIDVDTLASTLPSIGLLTKADVVVVASLQGEQIASTLAGSFADRLLPHLVARAESDPSPTPTATGYGYLNGELYSVMLAPVRTPDIVAWLAIGFRIDMDFARRLREQTGIDLTFLDQQGRPLATTLPPSVASALVEAWPKLGEPKVSTPVRLGRETALVATRRVAAGESGFATLALQYSLDEKLKPARAAERLMLWVASGSVVLAVFVSRGFARRLARPIVELVGQTRRIAAGDYEVQAHAYRRDELGRLAEAFDQMAVGLAERDRVRDLLDKNVSPEVAAQLLRDGAALGGEEREVTILFSDLRGFTTLSEKLAPRDLLTLLNRYLDRMSHEIEQRGGVIDKFIGDAIMALFGAPLAQENAADRATAAAVAMERALVDLNRELAGEGLAPLALGVGINTARVVAGNIGSHRRLNYSVIGDGVNVAARLQALTRTPEYHTNIIVSAATRAAWRERDAFAHRVLGQVQVKGRAEAVEIFAVDGASVASTPRAATVSLPAAPRLP